MEYLFLYVRCFFTVITEIIYHTYVCVCINVICICNINLFALFYRTDEEWPTVITFRGTHNHPIDNPAALMYRKMSAEVKDKLIALFHQGYDASSALHCLKTDLLLQYGDEYYKYACDGKYVPSLSIVHHLFYSEFSEDPNLKGEPMFKKLQEKLIKYMAENKGKAVFSYTAENNYFIVICTPLMLRAQEVLQQSKEIILVDSSGGMDKDKNRLYFFITPTAAGGVPLAAVVSDTEKKIVFDEALNKLKEIVPNFSSLKQKGPQVFMTDNDLKERDCLKKHFPNSRLLLCQFHVLKAVWAWLLKQSHSIHVNDRQQTYFLFKKVLYSNTESTFFKNNEFLLGNETVKKYNSFIEYYKKLLLQKEDWGTCFRSNLLIRGTNTTNYVEVMFRILKECILKRVMAFNLSQFIDFILTRFEMYFQKRLIDFCHGRYNNYSIQNMKERKIKEFVVEQQAADSDTFKLYDSVKKEHFLVDLTNGLCSCFYGRTGKVCEHSAFLLKELYDKVKSKFNYSSVELKRTMFYVANGTLPPTNWFDPMIAPTSNLQLSSVEVSNDTSQMDFCTATVEEPTAIQMPKLDETEKENLKNFYKRIDEGLENDPQNFVPAVRKMLSNIQSTKTDSSFLSALYTFGKHQNILSVKCARDVVKRRCHKNIIGVQPTAKGRRLKSSGQKIIKAGRRKKEHTFVKEHDYTTFGYLPKRKKKAQHNLEDCVMGNKGLGN